MKIKNLVLSLFVVILVIASGCMDSQKLPAPNETEIATPYSTEQKLPGYNETPPVIKTNVTFETWSMGYYSNYSYMHTYFRVITNYTKWRTFLDDQGYYIGTKGERTLILEGQLFPGLAMIPKTMKPADFNEHFIIAAMMGYKTKVSPEIEIMNISRINSTVNITVRIYEPSSGGSAISAPYHIVIVRKDAMLMGNYTFVFADTEGKLLGKMEAKI